MSYSIDANILLYASDNGNSLHKQANDFLKDCFERQETLCICWPTLMAYLRIATHPRIFDQPLTPSQAMGNVEGLIGLPQVRMFSEEDDFWTFYCRAKGDLQARGNLVPDIQIAALLLQHDVRTIYTNDADFKKFDFLEVRNLFGS